MNMNNRNGFVCLLVLLLAGCGPRPATPRRISADSPAVKMRHQIMFLSGGETHIFEGFMIRQGEALLVKGFAGPGVDLFTIVRNGKQHRETLHFESLAERIDVHAIGSDIARVYLGGCPRQNSPSERCELLGEPMVERFDGQGRLVERFFPEAHGIGLTVRYAEYAEYGGHLQPSRITLSWGKSANQMIIKLLSWEIASDWDPALFDLP